MNTYNNITTYSKHNTTNYIPNHIYEGRMNETILPEFVEICKKTQKELIEWLPKILIKEGYTDVVYGKGYIYAKGKIPVLLTAHMDTVHDDKMIIFYEREENGKHIISSPQGIGGDDRCGIYMILEIIKTHKCSVLFCEDEEIGGVGSKAFCTTDLISELTNLNYLIELDRANANDAVFYDCDNKDFTKFILDNTGFKEEYGSFSDISYLAPASGVAAVNLSCGYYHAHTLKEEVVIEEMLTTIEVVKKLLDVESERFEYIETPYYQRYARYGYYYDDYYYNYYNNSYYNKNNNKEVTLVVYLEDGPIIVHGSTIDEAWKNFFFEHSSICYNEVLDYEFLENSN